MNTNAVRRTLGVCYYPEHWPEDSWADDARRMVELGLTWVRIGEFSWSRIEPSDGVLELEWLDRAISVLHEAGLQVVLGTPTATPPRWMIDKHPDMLAYDASGNPRKFGSRRHYCFSHAGYHQECERIAEVFAKRYSENEAICAWQVDNEYGCHDTTLSYSPSAKKAFQVWLKDRYGTIERLNSEWGNVFWSMEYSAFEDVDLPNQTVTEPNPSHSLAFRRFSSDQVVRFNRLQVDVIRKYSNAPILHNFMGRETDFDHYEVGKDLDIATWDSYPLGFLQDRVFATPEHKERYLRQGDPDFQAFHHDLYRSVGKGRWWVIEQQPGPVNWAAYNPAPLPGMVKLWTWEAFAHGAEAVCYFRWRQAPFAQEQMHSGLLRPNGAEAIAFAEVKELAEQLRDVGDVSTVRASIALVFDYDSEFGWKVQPHARHLSYFDLVFNHYRALRSLGLSVDIVSPQDTRLAEYKLLLIPGILAMEEHLIRTLERFDGVVLAGPRTAVRNSEFCIPEKATLNLPGLDQIDATYAESLPPDYQISLKSGGSVGGYFELIEGDFEIIRETVDEKPAVVKVENYYISNGCLDQRALYDLIGEICSMLDIETIDLPEGVRVRDTQSERFWFNYGPQSATVCGREIASAGVVIEPLGSNEEKLAS